MRMMFVCYLMSDVYCPLPSVLSCYGNGTCITGCAKQPKYFFSWHLIGAVRVNNVPEIWLFTIKYFSGASVSVECLFGRPIIASEADIRINV